MKRFILAAALAVSAMPASAADLFSPSLKDDVDYAVRSWTGFHVGIHGAYDWATTNADTNIPGVAMSGDAMGGSFRPGVNLGYDVQLGRMVAGVFADYTAGLDGMEATAGLGPIAVGFKADIAHTWTVGGRLGYLVTNRTLLYGLGGYTWAKTTNADVSLAGITLATLPIGDLSGFTLGAGIEREIGAGFRLKAEYRHTWLEDANIAIAPGANVGMGGNVNSIRVGLSYQF